MAKIPRQVSRQVIPSGRVAGAIIPSGIADTGQGIEAQGLADLGGAIADTGGVIAELALRDRKANDLKQASVDAIDRQNSRLAIEEWKNQNPLDQHTAENFSKVWDQKKVDKSLQMTVYALAATDPGIYAKKPEEVVLSFYFLQTGEKKSTKRTAKQLEQSKKEILAKAREIEKSDFPPKPSKLCDFCDYRLICEA